MAVKMNTLVLLLWIIAGAAATDFRNETIDCVFREYDKCYKNISSLGASFTHWSDVNVEEISFSCKNELNVQHCIMNVATSCRSAPVFDITQRITLLVHDICTYKSANQTMFLNSSSCYNKLKRDECVRKFDFGKNRDAKSLCCSNLKTLRCLEEEMQGVCPRNYTQFRTNIMETYRGYHFFICGPYLKYCNAAAQLLSAWGILAATVISVVTQRLYPL